MSLPQQIGSAADGLYVFWEADLQVLLGSQLLRKIEIVMKHR
jgi:hypothetical protein